MKMKWGISVAVAIILALFAMAKYNTFVGLEEKVNQTYSQVQNVMQRQADLIPNLVETVKGYAAHENKTFTMVAEARSKLTAVGKMDPAKLANDPELQKKLIEAQQAANQAMISLNAVKEAYPQLQANENFKSLMAELAGSQNRITVERMANQKAVQEYNQTVRVVPGALVAGLFGFKTKPYFQADDGAQKAPQVKF